MKNLNTIFHSVIISISMVAIPCSVEAQYFGQNKMRYEDFKFNVLETPHFEIYHYLKNDSIINNYAQLSERWYKIHQRLLRDTIKYNNPLILYSNHADFQQTTTISGRISVGTGGVTEALKNRVVMPIMESHSQTDHVLGHELVHAFQYNLFKSSDSLSLNNIQNLPLWMVEGMAEYLSIGSNDAHTAMWMRDAVINDDIPTIEDLTKRPDKYFPYRYGQAFWSFVGGVWGDGIIPLLFVNTAKMGLDNAVDSIFNFDTETMSELWASSMKKNYGQYLKDSTENTIGDKLVSIENAGEINVSPSISPDGRYMVFLSEKDIFSLDLYLADAQTGKIIRKITTKKRNDHIDDLSYLESAGTWGPDNRRFAYVVFSEGKTKLVVIDAFKGRLLHETEIPGVPSFGNPTWSPDGNEIVVSGLVEGQSDLYLYNLKNDETVQLTNDVYSDIQPHWSPDGNKIAFATDRVSIKQDVEGKYDFNISILNLESGNITDTPIFPGADNLNPTFTHDGKGLLFISNRDGFRNMYKYEFNDSSVYQLTDLFTGISGITAYSPAISTDRTNGRIVYTHYYNHEYKIYGGNTDEFLSKKVDINEVDFTAANLPPFDRHPVDIVDEQLSTINKFERYPKDSLKAKPYNPKFKLDYIGNSGGVGITTGRFGTGLMGGVNMLFSDILGTNTLFTGVSINGEIYDFGGQVAYINKENTFSWGASLSHIPYRTGRVGIKQDSLNIQDTALVVDNIYQDLIRIFEDRVNVFGSYPFTQHRRIEAGASFARYSYRVDRYSNYYHEGYLVDRDKNKRPSPDGFNLYSTNLAYVGDDSNFGIASPLKGHRYRFEAEKYLGEYNYHAFLADYRRYIFFNPFTVAFRGYHYARYGRDINNEAMTPLYLGYQNLIRGYNNINYGSRAGISGSEFSVNDLIGNKILVANAELRLPFTGPERLSVINSRTIFTELALFVDGGIAWDAPTTQTPEGNNQQNLTVNEDRHPVFSAGLSGRINVFGQIILEPYYAIPFQRKDVKFGTFGLNFIPGW